MQERCKQGQQAPGPRCIAANPTAVWGHLLRGSQQQQPACHSVDLSYLSRQEIRYDTTIVQAASAGGVAACDISQRRA